MTYSSNVVVLPVPANARTSMICSARRSAETIACCSCVSVLFPPSTRRVSASSRWPTARPDPPNAPRPRRPVRARFATRRSTTPRRRRNTLGETLARARVRPHGRLLRRDARGVGRNVTVSPSSAAAKRARRRPPVSRTNTTDRFRESSRSNPRRARRRASRTRRRSGRKRSFPTRVPPPSRARFRSLGRRERDNRERRGTEKATTTARGPASQERDQT